MLCSPKISIIIPAYQAENYIEQALGSIKQQIYTNWEVLIVEDAWKDRTEEIVNSFRQEVGQEKVHFIRNPVNLGLAGTRNVAIKRAKGEYIALLDHDDIWQPTYLEKSVDFLLKSGASLSYSSARRFSEFDSDLGIWGPTEEELKNFPRSLLERNYITPSATIIKKEILESVNGFDASIRSCEDYDCWIRLARRGEKFIHVPGELCLYRQHQESLTRNSKVMAETMMYVVKKHSDWSAIPHDFWKMKMATTYIRLSKAYFDDDFGKSFKFAVQAWLKKPNDVEYWKYIARIIRDKLIKIKISYLA